MIPVSQVINFLEEHLGEYSEIVLHNLALSYERTIIDIRNGHITGRKLGECGTNLGLEMIRGTIKDDDRYNYITNTRSGKVLRSSTLMIKDNGKKLVGSLCINTDITELLRFENYLQRVSNYSHTEKTSEKTEEIFATNINELLEYFINQAQKLIDKAVPIMSKKDKIRFLNYLDKKGVFLITYSSEKVCEYLNISKYTLYNYLETIRNRDEL